MDTWVGCQHIDGVKVKGFNMLLNIDADGTVLHLPLDIGVMFDVKWLVTQWDLSWTMHLTYSSWTVNLILYNLTDMPNTAVVGSLILNFAEWKKPVCITSAVTFR